jgi:hypothetical protein
MPPTPSLGRRADGAIWYFAYGSNMSPTIFLERREMHPLAASRARLDGYRLIFDIPVGSGERGVANVEPSAGAHVWGVAYLLLLEECERLDRTEGVHSGLYARIAVDVLLGGERRLVAFTYRSSIAVNGRKPSPRYIALLIEGARRHRLPADYVTSLEALELAVDERHA